MKEEYLSISEFAKRAGVSVQAVYKRLGKDLQPWLRVENGKKTLNSKALQVFSGEKSSTEVESVDALKKALELIADQNETLKAELAIKNEQIREQSRQIAEISERLKESHLLIDHQQKLTAAGLLTTAQPQDPDENDGESPTQQLDGDMQQKSKEIRQLQEQLSKVSSALSAEQEKRERMEQSGLISRIFKTWK